jgi:hypothetical protein
VKTLPWYGIFLGDNPDYTKLDQYCPLQSNSLSSFGRLEDYNYIKKKFTFNHPLLPLSPLLGNNSLDNVRADGSSEFKMIPFEELNIGYIQVILFV